VFALDLMSTYEGEHTIFGLLGQANLTQWYLYTMEFYAAMKKNEMLSFAVYCFYQP
jgi:hypothetical protein